MDDFPGNSRRQQMNNAQPRVNTPPAEEKEPKLEPVVTGNVIRRKKSLGRRLLDTFFRGEGGVLQYLAREVLVPALQNLVIDTVTEGIEKAVGVPSRQRRQPFRGGVVTPRTHISYDRPSTTVVRSPINNGIPARRAIPQSPSSVDVGEVIVDSQVTAQVILERLEDTIKEYKIATVANLRELLGETSHPMDHRWGWTEDDTFDYKRDSRSGGWRLIIPDPVDLR